MGPDRPHRGPRHDPSRTTRANGCRPEGMETRAVPFEEIDEPVDLVAVQADDEFLTALSVGAPVSFGGRTGHERDDRLAAMLAAWKAEVEAEPIPELVDIDTASETILRAAEKKKRGRGRHLVPLAAAAALVVLVGGGISVGAQDARPGDALFPITKVLYQDHARSAEAAATIAEANSRARALLEIGDVQGAAEAIAIAKQAAADVQPDDGRDQLLAETEFLEAKADETPQGTPADLSTPPSARRRTAGGPSQTVGGGPQGTGPESASSSPSGEVPKVAPEPAGPETTSSAPAPDQSGGGGEGTRPTSDAPTTEGEPAPPPASEQQGAGPGPSNGTAAGGPSAEPSTPAS